jgi:hypothetical protein
VVLVLTAGFPRNKLVRTAFKTSNQGRYQELQKQFSTKCGLVASLARKIMPTIRQHNTRLFVLFLIMSVFCNVATKPFLEIGDKWRDTFWIYARFSSTCVVHVKKIYIEIFLINAPKSYLEKSNTSLNSSKGP